MQPEEESQSSAAEELSLDEQLLKFLGNDPVSLAALKAASEAIQQVQQQQGSLEDLNIPGLDYNTLAAASTLATALQQRPPMIPPPAQSKKKEGESNRKQYVHKACVNCKASHVGCDASRPCKRCVRLNKEDSCIDAERKKRGRPSNSTRQRVDLMNMGMPKLVDPNYFAALQAQAMLQQAHMSKPPTTNHRPILPSLLPQDPSVMIQRMLAANLAAQAHIPEPVPEPVPEKEEEAATITPDFSVLTKPEEERTDEDRAILQQIQNQLLTQIAGEEADPNLTEELKKIIASGLQQEIAHE
ncbi:hypothetical protein EDD86DRAFT_246342 [Gorgonomyces haynaldii]|nr:hypothetical protein EDD86DRAFT_246342 [Gorgonomyces haynaldii]